MTGRVLSQTPDVAGQPDRASEGGRSLSGPATSGRGLSSVDAPEQHDERCEAEFITGPMAYSPCGCAERASGRVTSSCMCSDNEECYSCDPPDEGRTTSRPTRGAGPAQRVSPAVTVAMVEAAIRAWNVAEPDHQITGVSYHRTFGEVITAVFDVLGGHPR